MQTSTTTRAPGATNRAAVTMYAGLALSALLAVLTFVDQIAIDGISDAMWAEYPDYTSGEISTEAGATAAGLYVIAGLGIACWLWLASATRRDWRRIRWVSGTVFTLALIAAMSMSYVPMPGYLATAMWLPCVAGVVALAQLWMSRSR